MSLTRVKDLDYMLCLMMSDETLSAFCKINRYYYNLNVWSKKIALFKIGKYLHKGRKLDELYYYELKRTVEGDVVKGVFDAIENDRLDLLALLFTHHDLNPNYLFCFDEKYSSYIQGGKYISEIKDASNFCFSFKPSTQIIRRGSYDMWNFLITRGLHALTRNDDYISAIEGKNLNIVKDIVILHKISITAHILMHAIRFYNPEVTLLFLDHIEQEEIDALVTFMKESSIFSKQLYYEYDWITEDNCALQLFLDNVDDKVLRKKMSKNSRKF